MAVNLLRRRATEEMTSGDDVRGNEGEDVRAREDEWLVVRCQLGERPAFDELVQRWADPIWKCLRRLTGDEDAADDFAQDVWLRVVRGIGGLRDGSRLRPWLFGIARRASMDRLRRRYATPAATEVDIADLAAENTSVDLEEDLATLERNRRWNVNSANPRSKDFFSAPTPPSPTRGSARCSSS